MADIAGERKNVVIVSTSWWDSELWFRRQHFAQRFANLGWRVLYVEPFVSIVRPFRRRSEVAARKLIMFLKRRQIADNLEILSLPPGVPLGNTYAQVSIFNRRLVGYYIQHEAKRFFSNGQYVMICYNPFDVYLRTDDSCLLVYECVDEHTGYPENMSIKDDVHEAERLLMKKADVVTATSHSLDESKREWRDDIIHIPNGVDLSSFFVTSQDIGMPIDLQHILRPIIIYVGAMFQWFNLGLVKRICESHREWSVVLIGPEGVLSGQTLPHNLYYLGVKNWKTLPAYLKWADVGIIPFIENELTVNVDPLKLYEYFAAGLSCVSSFMRGTQRYAEPYVLEVARNDSDFIAALERNIGNKQEKLDRKRAIAQDHSWDTIFGLLENCIVAKCEGSRCKSSFLG